MSVDQVDLISYNFKGWFKKQGYAVHQLDNKQKWVQAEMYGCYNRNLQVQKQIANNPKQYETISLTTSLNAQQLTNPFRSYDCNYGSCIFNEQQLRNLLLDQFHIQYNSIRQRFRKFSCPICKETKQIEQKIPNEKRLEYLYHDNKLQLYIDMARQQYQDIMKNMRQNATNIKNQQEKNKMLKKISYLQTRFKRCQLKIYKNGCVDLYYNDTLDQKAPYKVYNLFPPSNIDTDIYYNPTDSYNYAIKNKDSLKIVQNVLINGIIEQIKNTINMMENYGVSGISLQRYINQANDAICKAFQNNITIVNTRQQTQPLVQIIKPQGFDMKYLLLQVFYPYQRSWNIFQIKSTQEKLDMLTVIEPTTQIYVKKNFVFLLSPSSLYKISLKIKKNLRFEMQSVEYMQRIANIDTQQTIFDENKIDEIPKSKEGIVTALFAQPLQKLQQYKINLQGITFFNNCLYFFGGRIQKYNELKQKVQVLSKSIYCLNLDKNQWKLIEVQLPNAVHSPTIIEDGSKVFIIGGQLQNCKWQNPHYSQKIVQFDLETEKIIQIIQIIQENRYQSTYFVTKSVEQGVYKLISCKQHSQIQNKYINGLIFDINAKTIINTFKMDNNFMKVVTQLSKENVCTYFNYPSVCTTLNDINYAIITSLSNPKQRQLIYGHDTNWLISGIKKKLI